MNDRNTLCLILEIFKENKKKLDEKKIDDKRFYEIFDSFKKDMTSLLEDLKKNKNKKEVDKE